MPLARLKERFYSNAIWTYRGSSEGIYLTFDDGPHPETTEALLELLDRYKVKASFFLLGKRVEQFPELFKKYEHHGHVIGNHSYTHLNGWTHGTKSSLRDFQQCEQVFTSKYYRPPYGKTTPQAASEIAKSHQIIMWDFLVNEFKARSADYCFQRFVSKCKKGSIVVFHENDKSKDILLELVERCLIHIGEKDWKCLTLH
ncbi:MAG: polysaccharide deacetylase family protein [Bacteroidota bacterium]